MSSRRTNGDGEDLNDKERLFVAEYLHDSNGKRAAIAAGYSETSAHNRACILLKKSSVRMAIKTRQDKLIRKVGIRNEDALRQLLFTLTRDALDYCDPETGKLITDVRLLPERARASINGIEQEITIINDRDGNQIGERVKTKLRLVPKEKAIEMAMNHKGLFRQGPGTDGKFEVDWAAIHRDTEVNPVDLIVANPLKYLTQRPAVLDDDPARGLPQYDLASDFRDGVEEG